MEDSKAKQIGEYVLGRLKEPSTWAGIAVFIASFGVDSDTLDRVVSNGPALAAGIAAIVAIAAPSRGRKALEEARTAREIAETALVKADPIEAETYLERTVK